MMAPWNNPCQSPEPLAGSPCHVTVLKEESVRFLDVQPNGLYLDATLGGGGHSEMILEMLNDFGKLIGIDRDRTALKRAVERLQRFGSRFEARHGNFADIASLLLPEERGKVQGIVIDLGVSSFQLDEAERGFSFQRSGPLDMRMDRDQKQQLLDLLGKKSAKDLTKAIGRLGEERFARRIAEAIKREMAEGQLATTEDLANVVASAVPRKFWPQKIHVATKTFMALRMLLNQELENLERFLENALDALAPRRTTGRHQLSFAGRPHGPQRHQRMDPSPGRPSGPTGAGIRPGSSGRSADSETHNADFGRSRRQSEIPQCETEGGMQEVNHD